MRLRVLNGLAGSLGINVLVLFGAKALSLLLIYVLNVGFSIDFSEYARLSISAGLWASVLILGFPYAMQVMAQDEPDSIFKLVTSLLAFSAVSYLSCLIFNKSLAFYLSVMIFGIPSVAVAFIYEYRFARSWLVYAIHAVFVVSTQPLVFLITYAANDVGLHALRIQDALLCLGLLVLYMLVCWSHLRFFFFQCITVFLGSGVAAFMLSEGVAYDNSFNAGLLWVVIQAASALSFITSSMNSRLISIFYSARLQGSNFDETARYGYLVVLCFLAALLSAWADGILTASFVYAFYLLLQGFVRVSGSIVMSLRTPIIPLVSAAGSFVSVVAVSVVLQGEHSLTAGVVSVVSASIGGALAMWLALSIFASVKGRQMGGG